VLAEFLETNPAAIITGKKPPANWTPPPANVPTPAPVGVPAPSQPDLPSK
jgi:hypothetical protein